ncbi:MAG: cytochrome C [Rubrivivax sp.]|nr:cytochrome C [Rubrivivax sp.]
MRPGLWILLALAAVAGAAHADAQLAYDKGCFNCHGDPPRQKTPTFAQLAADYAKVRGDAAAQARLAEKLRAGSFFGHIGAHERLSEADALRLVRWIADGASTP